MAIITLTTDFGRKDYYVSAVKGAILNVIPQVTIIDISHEISKFNILEAAYIVKSAYPNFPKGTIHIISVESTNHRTSNYIVVEYRGSYFIGPDNGVISLILEGNYDRAYEISQNSDDAGLDSFPLKTVYSKIAGFIASGGELEGIYEKIDRIFELLPLKPIIRGAFIQASVVYVDHYGNLILNVNRDMFTEVGNGRPFKIYYMRNDYIDYICANYNDVQEGDVVCIFGETGNMEIAINKDNASSLLDLNYGSSIQIEFI
jgi:Uncharacterized conserved protein